MKVYDKVIIMDNFTYVVFNETGVKISKELKNLNKKCKIIHFSDDDYLLNNSIADVKINFDIVEHNSLWNVFNEFCYYKSILKDERVSSLVENIIKKEKRIIVINDFFELETNDLYEYVVRVLMKNKKEFKTVSCSPFSFMGMKRKKAFEEVNKRISVNDKNNLYFDCDDLRDETTKKICMEKIIELTQMILAKIAIDPAQNINLLIEKEKQKFRESYKNKIDSQLMIFIGGAGIKIHSKYRNRIALKALDIHDENSYMNENHNTLILKNNDTNYLDGYYKLGLKRYEDNKKELIEIIKKYKKITIVCGLGGSCGTAGLIYLSRLAKDLGVNCDAIISTPFKFEGERKYSDSQLALKEAQLNHCITINLDKFYNDIKKSKIVKGTCGTIFEEIDEIFCKYLDLYETKIINNEEIIMDDFDKEYNHFLEKNIRWKNMYAEIE